MASSLDNDKVLYGDMDLNALLKDIMGSIKTCMAFAEYIYLTNGIFRSATERIAKYFITDLKYNKLDNEQKNEIQKMLEQTLDVRTAAGQALIELQVYGNCITFIYLPFIRQLTCLNSRCKTSYNIEKIKYSFTNGIFSARCPRCGYQGPFRRSETNLQNSSKIKIINLDPKLVDIDNDPISGQTDYYYQLDQEYKRKILDGNPHILNHIPWVFYEAAKRDKTIKFAENQVFHMRAPTISGLYKGWGSPQVVTLTNYLIRSHYYSKASLAILKDFIVPKRIISPSGSPDGKNGPLSITNGGDFLDNMQNMFKKSRKDPTATMISPFPVNIQSISGDGKALDLSGEEKFNNEQQLAAAGYPSELFYMNMNTQALPTSLRLFESYWSHIPVYLNKWLDWVLKRISSFMQIETPEVEWESMRISDDIQRRQVLLNLAGAQQVSLKTALKPFGIDFEDELGELLNQSKIQQEKLEEAAEEEAIKVQIAGSEQPDSPGSGQAQGQGAEALQAQASQIAEQWVQMQEGPRHQSQEQLRQQDRTLHLIAMGIYEGKMAQLRQQIGADGIHQMRQGGGQQ